MSPTKYEKTIVEEEYKTYQPRWEEKKKKAESEKREHHRHRHYSYGYSDDTSSSRSWSFDVAGWLKRRDKQAWVGLMLIVVVVVSYSSYRLYNIYKADFHVINKNADSEPEEMDELGDNLLYRELSLERGADLAEKTNTDTLVKPVTGEYHNVYRPPKKEENVTIDDREWGKIKQNLGRWFRANGRDWRFILGVTALGLLIIGLSIYGIYKHNHPHGRYKW